MCRRSLARQDIAGSRVRAKRARELLSASIAVIPLLMGDGLRPSGWAIAAEPAFAEPTFRYAIIDQDLRDALLQFGSNMHLRVSMSDTVRGRLGGQVYATSPQRFLDLITLENGLDWYYDGYMLYITTTGEGVSKLVKVPAARMDLLRRDLEASGIADARFPLRELPEGNQMLVSGPPHFVELVEQAAAALVPHQRPPADTPTSVPADHDNITVYRGTAKQDVDLDASPAGSQ